MAKNKWHSVKKTKPPEGEHVLGWNKSDGYFVCRYHVYTDEHDGWGEYPPCDRGTFRDPTHWKPLPSGDPNQKLNKHYHRY